MKEKIIEILKDNIMTYQLIDDSDPIQITGFELATDKILALIEYDKIHQTIPYFKMKLIEMVEKFDIK